MDYINIPINKQEQYNKIIEDTEEIIKSFREISELMVSKLDKKNDTMFKLGKSLINQRKEIQEEHIEAIGSSQVKFLL